MKCDKIKLEIFGTEKIGHTSSQVLQPGSSIGIGHVFKLLLVKNLYFMQITRQPMKLENIERHIWKLWNS
jgi:hypothetical protein